MIKEAFQIKGKSVMNGAEQLESHMERVGPLSLIQHKINSQWIKDLQKYQKKVYPQKPREKTDIFDYI